MKTMETSFGFCVIFLLVAMLNSGSATLQVGFYHSTCPSVESVVRKAVNKAVARNPGIGAGLIRMHFHDCFVRGCDASILLDSTPGNPAEKEHPANNPSLRGYEVIDEAKAELEYLCPQTVSCADILAFAARDSTYKLGSINYAVPAGRRDGLVSLRDEPSQNLPPPSLDAQQLEANFARKGLSREEMVTLSGAHSVGVLHCSSFSTRLSSFNATHKQDPSMEPRMASELKAKCLNNGGASDPTVPLDFATPNRLDNKYYTNLKNHRGVLTSDQTLFDSPSTAYIVRKHANRGGAWANKFAAAMVKMGSIDILTGNQGEIRRNCRVVN
ncbi:peroxidase 5 [Eucalyptus grandis]|uniref:peroxidase 5 n=1 Tax=Eucalyptus grandis TaxID=71139 RepID=UPI00192E8F31|nr:peroxidase 5 [Eucalyptus grandis]